MEEESSDSESSEEVVPPPRKRSKQTHVDKRGLKKRAVKATFEDSDPEKV